MSSKDSNRHRGLEWRRIALAGAGAVGVIATALAIGALTGDSATQVEARSNVGEALESGAIAPALRQKLAMAGRKRSRLFSWERTAQETLESYKRVWAQSSRLA